MSETSTKRKNHSSAESESDSEYIGPMPDSALKPKKQKGWLKFFAVSDIKCKLVMKLNRQF
jgi:hypothetical protein